MKIQKTGLPAVRICTKMARMSEVETLFSAPGRVGLLAAALPSGKYHTVYAWKRQDFIPPWRRAAVLDAVRRLNWQLPAEVFAYLATDGIAPSASDD